MFEQIHTHMMTHSLYPEFQSAYRKNHSTETALVRVMNDILMKMNTQEVTLLIMLDLSAAFDMVNHNILLTRLNMRIGLGMVQVVLGKKRSVSLHRRMSL